jgi:hypothetical protein
MWGLQHSLHSQKRILNEGPRAIIVFKAAISM